MTIAASSVSIHIVNWNGGNTILDCLETVFGQDYPNPKEVIVVDNASKDGSLEQIEKIFPQVNIIRNHENLGFSKAHNRAIHVSAGDFVLVLNYDILLEENFLSPMIQAMGEDPKVGMVSGKLYRLIEGKKTDLLDSTGITMARYFSCPRGAGERDVGQYDKADQRAIFGPCGAAALYRRQMLEDIRYQQEYFDEDFVNYVEDVDLAWRAQLRGWKGVYVSDAVAYHERGVTRKANPVEKRNYFLRGFRNRYLAMIKNITGYEWGKTRHKILLGEFLFLIGRNDGMNCFSVRCKALKEAKKAVMALRDKRAYIQGRLQVDPERMMAYFDYVNVRFFSAMGGYVKASVHGFLCRFFLGRVLIRRFGILKKKILSS